MTYFSKKLIPKDRGFYAIKTGEWAGCFVTYIAEHSRADSYAFLLQPDPMKCVFWLKDDVHQSFNNKDFEFIAILPRDVYDVSKACFEHHMRKSNEQSIR